MAPEDGVVEGNEYVEDMEGLPGVAETVNPDGLMADDLDEMEQQRESGDEIFSDDEEPEEAPELDGEEEGKEAPSGEEESEIFTVDGKPYTAAQIRELEAGNLRQSDYTKKTTETANKSREAEQITKNFQNLIDEATGRNNYEQQRRQPTAGQTALDEFATPAEQALSQQVHSLAHEIGEMKRQGIERGQAELLGNMKKSVSDFQSEHELADEDMGNIIGRINDVHGVVCADSLDMARNSMIDREQLRQDAVKEYLARKDADKEETKVVIAPDGGSVEPVAVDVKKLSDSELEAAMRKDPVW